MTTTEAAPVSSLPLSGTGPAVNPRLARVRARAAARESIRAMRPAARAKRRRRTPEELRSVVERGQAQLNACADSPEAVSRASPRQPAPDRSARP